MQTSVVRVFLSSTWLDLRAERRAVEAILHRFQETKFVGMEYFGSRMETTRRASLNEVNRSQIYIGIFGECYGSGITEAEYKRAMELGLPCFIYFKDKTSLSDHQQDKAPKKVAALRKLKAELSKRHTIAPFATPDGLAALVSTDLHNWLFGQYLRPALEAASRQNDEAGFRRLVDGVRDEGSLLTALKNSQSAAGEMLHGILLERNQAAIHALTSGITALQSDYAARVENFLTEYLGTPTQPVPFGGRDSDLEKLDAWLDDADAPAYALLAAPAGRGKSALLVHWSRRLFNRKDLAIVFFPVSIRFHTNLSSVVFAALTARLAELHNEKVPSDPHTPPEVWQRLMTDYLIRPLPKRRRLLLILDGADEAADWDPGPHLFPLNPPQGLRIVLSARYRAGDFDETPWLRTLGWNRFGLATSFRLAPLSRVGVADVLKHMGFPLDRLGKRVDIVAELHRLSEGDPLLVRVYVDDLWERGEWAARMAPEDLRTIRPGLKGYFDSWWQDQRRLWGEESPMKERSVGALLSILSCALGSLSQDDILSLMPSEMKFSSWTLEDAMRYLRRFVIGDGRHQGYVFSHPRLGMYFREQLTEQERVMWDEQFLEWGRRVATSLGTGQCSPEKSSVYVVQYYGAHLEKSGLDVGAFLPLVSDGWRCARERLDGSYAGFLHDVERCWRAAERANNKALRTGQRLPHIGTEIRCALVRTSVNSLVSSVPPELIAALVAQGAWSTDQGFAYACQIPNPVRRADALIGLIPRLPEEVGERAQRAVLESAQAIEETATQVRVLTGLWAYLRETLLGGALDVVQEIRSDLERAKTLLGLIPRLPDSLRVRALRSVLDAIRRIEDPGTQTELLTAVAPMVGEPVVHETFEVAQAVGEPNLRAQALAAVAPHLDKELLDAAVREILYVTPRAGEEPVPWMTSIVALLPQLSGESRDLVLKKAITVARSMSDPRGRARALVRLAPALCEAMLRETLAEVQAIGGGPIQGELLTALAPHLTEPLVAEAIEAAESVRDPRDRARALVSLAPRLSGSLLEETLHTIRAVEDSSLRIDLLRQIAPHLREDLQRTVIWLALGRSSAGNSSLSRANALMTLIPHLVPDVREDAVSALLDLSEEVADPSRRCQLVSELAPHLSGGQKEVALRQSLEAIDAVDDPSIRAELLTEVSSLFPEDSQEIALREALEGAQVVSDLDARVQALVRFVPYLPEALLRRTIEVIRITAPDRQLSLLGQITPNLTDTTLPDALEMARAMEQPALRVEAMVLLLPHMKGESKVAAVREALEATKGIDQSSKRAELLFELLPFVTDDVHHEVLEAARTIQDPESRVNALIRVAPVLLTGMRQVAQGLALDSIRDLHPANRPNDYLRRLSSQLDGETLQKAVDVAFALASPASKVWALLDLSPRLSGELRSSTLTRALDLVETLGWSSSQYDLIKGLLPHLPESLLGTAVEKSLLVRESRLQVQLLVEFLPRLHGPDRERVSAKALTATRQIGDVPVRLKMMVSLGEHLSDQGREGVHREALDLVRGEKDPFSLELLLNTLAEDIAPSLVPGLVEIARSLKLPDSRARTLISFLPKLSGGQRDAAARRALEAVRDVDSPERWTNLLHELIPHLEDRSKLVALRSVLRRSSRYFDELARVLEELLRDLPSDLMNKALRMIIRSTERNPYSRVRGELLLAVLPLMTEELLADALKVTSANLHARVRIEALQLLAPRLPRGLRERALRDVLASIETIKEESMAEIRLRALLPLLSEDLLPDALGIARRFLGPFQRVSAMASLLAHLSDESKEAVLREALEIVEKSGHGSTQRALMDILLPEIPPRLREEALRMVRTNVSPTWRARALMEVATSFPDYEQEEVLREAFRSVEEVEDPSFKAILLRRLFERFLEHESLEEKHASSKRVAFTIPLEARPRPVFLPTRELIEYGCDLVRGLSDPHEKAVTLQEIAPRVPAELREGLYSEAIEAAHSVKSFDVRIRLLTELLASVPAGLRGTTARYLLRDVHNYHLEGDLLAQLIRVVVEEAPDLLNGLIEIILEIDPDDRRQALQHLVDCVPSLGADWAYAVWRKALHRMSEQLRGEFIDDLSIFTPIVLNLGHDKVLAETAGSIMDVGGWWP